MFSNSSNGIFNSFFGLVSFIGVEEFEGIVELGSNGAISVFIFQQIIDGKNKGGVVIVFELFNQFFKGSSEFFKSIFLFFKSSDFITVGVSEIFKGLSKGFSVKSNFFGVIHSSDGGLDV